MLKEYRGVVVIGAVFATFMGSMFLGDFLWSAHQRAVARAETLAEARAEAKELTGPCGSQFVATVKDGDTVEHYIAGEQVNSSAVHLYEERVAADGTTTVYWKGNWTGQKNLGHKKLVMVRWLKPPESLEDTYNRLAPLTPGLSLSSQPLSSR